MGNIVVKFKAVRGKHVLEKKALVDSGAETTTLGLNDACRLGLDVEKAQEVDRVTAGGGKLSGLLLTGVTVTANNRKARLSDGVFVPIVQRYETTNKKTGEKKTVSVEADRDEEPLLGQDFLQKAKAFLDFSNDTLQGIEILGPPMGLSRRVVSQRPSDRQGRELIRALAVCRIPRKKKKAGAK